MAPTRSRASSAGIASASCWSASCARDQPVRAAPAAPRQRTASDQREPQVQAARGRASGPATSQAHRRLVRRRHPSRRGRCRYRPLVQGGHVPRRVLLLDRSGDGRGGYHHRACRRWSIESTFQESPLTSGRGRLGAGAGGSPCWRHRASSGSNRWSRSCSTRCPNRLVFGGIQWPGKSIVTFSGALCAVRLRLWFETVFREAGIGTGLEKLPEPVRDLLRAALTPAA